MSAIIAVIVLGLAGVGVFVSGIYVTAGLGPALLAGGVALFGGAVLLRSGIMTNG